MQSDDALWEMICLDLEQTQETMPSPVPGDSDDELWDRFFGGEDSEEPGDPDHALWETICADLEQPQETMPSPVPGDSDDALWASLFEDEDSEEALAHVPWDPDDVDPLWDSLFGDKDSEETFVQGTRDYDDEDAFEDAFWDSISGTLTTAVPGAEPKAVLGDPVPGGLFFPIKTFLRNSFPKSVYFLQNSFSKMDTKQERKRKENMRQQQFHQFQQIRQQFQHFKQMLSVTRMSKQLLTKKKLTLPQHDWNYLTIERPCTEASRRLSRM